MTEQEHQFANPAPMGLAALAMACFTFGALFLGKVSADAFPLLSCWLVGGAVVQFVTGFIELKERNIMGGNVFIFFSAFFMLVAALSVATKYALMKAGLPYDSRIEGYGWMAGAAFLTIITPNYLRSSSLFFLLVVLIDVALWCIVGMDLRLAEKETFAPVVGWALMIAGWIGIYLAGAIMLNTAQGRVVLPMPGPIVKSK